MVFFWHFPRDYNMHPWFNTVHPNLLCYYCHTFYLHVINPTRHYYYCYMKQSKVFHVCSHIYTFWCFSYLLSVLCFQMIITSRCFSSMDLLVNMSLTLIFLKVSLFCFHFWWYFKWTWNSRLTTFYFSTLRMLSFY